MREKTIFNTRTTVRENRDVIIKYFLVFEGAKTEEIYFDAVISHRTEIGIDPIIELVPLIRDFGESGWSNPRKIVDRVIENISEAITGNMTYDILINRIISVMSQAGIISDNPYNKATRIYWRIMKEFCEDVLQKSMDDIVDDIESLSQKLITLLRDQVDITNLPENIPALIRSMSLTYDDTKDRICIIVDRDKDSFIATTVNNQYQHVVNACKKYGFNLFVTNPCFEFWLLLHFDDVDSLDMSKLLENNYVTKNKKFTEHELSKRIPYKKNKYNADFLVSRLNLAIKNEAKYCEDIDSLMQHVGSNLGKLFKMIMKSPQHTSSP